MYITLKKKRYTVWHVFATTICHIISRFHKSYLMLFFFSFYFLYVICVLYFMFRRYNIRLGIPKKRMPLYFNSEHKKYMI